MPFLGMVASVVVVVQVLIVQLFGEVALLLLFQAGVVIIIVVILISLLSLLLSLLLLRNVFIFTVISCSGTRNNAFLFTAVSPWGGHARMRLHASEDAAPPASSGPKRKFLAGVTGHLKKASAL